MTPRLGAGGLKGHPVSRGCLGAEMCRLVPQSPVHFGAVAGLKFCRSALEWPSTTFCGWWGTRTTRWQSQSQCPPASPQLPAVALSQLALGRAEFGSAPKVGATRPAPPWEGEECSSSSSTSVPGRSRRSALLTVWPALVGRCEGVSTA